MRQRDWDIMQLEVQEMFKKLLDEIQAEWLGERKPLEEVGVNGEAEIFSQEKPELV